MADSGIFLRIGLSIDQVLQIRDKAQAAVLAGSVTVSSTIGEVSFSKTMPQGMSPLEILEACAVFLQTKDPDAYGRRVTRVYHDFSRS